MTAFVIFAMVYLHGGVGALEAEQLHEGKEQCELSVKAELEVAGLVVYYVECKQADSI